MKADPKVSEGARSERAAFRAYLRRLLKGGLSAGDAISVNQILTWVQGRQERYDRHPGGLGKR